MAARAHIPHGASPRCVGGRRARLALVLALAAALALPAAGGGAAHGATRRVPADHATIGAALGAALPGDTVEVAAGVYATATGEVFPLALPGGVLLRAPDGPLAAVIAADQPMPGPLVAARGPSATPPGSADALSRIEGFTLQGSGLAQLGALVDRAGATIARCAVVGFTGAGATGCRLTGPGAPRLERCTIAANTRGVDASQGASPRIENCILASADSIALVCDASLVSPLIRCNVYFANRRNVQGPNATCLFSQDNGTNLLVDPLFCDRLAGDFRLSSQSPVAAGAPATSCGAVGALDIGCARPAPILAAVSPDRLVRPGVVEIDLLGAYLGPWVLARVIGADAQEAAGALVLADSARATFRFDLGSFAKGECDVALADSTGRGTTLARALRIVRAETLDVPGAHATISEALAGAFEGDTVRVGAGVFGDATGEPMPIRLRGGVALAGAGAAATTIRSAGGVIPGLVDEPAIAVAVGPLLGGDADSTTLVRGIRFEGGGLAAAIVRGVEASPVVRDCVVAGARLGAGAGVALSGGAALVERCTIVRCGVGIRMLNFATPRIGACLIAMNDVAMSCDEASAPEVACTNIWASERAAVEGCADPTGAGGNVALDPRFCARVRGSLALAADSPCAPAGSGGCGRVGALDVACALPDPTRVVAVPEAQPTWSEAFAVSIPGDTVLIEPGEYGAGEVFPLRLGRGRVVRSRGSPDATRLALPNAGPYAPVLVRAAGDSASALVGLTLDGRGRADLLVAADSGRGERIDRCVLLGASGSPIGSAAVRVASGHFRVERSLLYGNANGVLGVLGGSVRLERSIVARSERYGIFCDDRSSIQAVCNDVWGSTGADYAGACGALLGQLGNVSVDPLFCGEATQDFLVMAESPLVGHCGGTLDEAVAIGPFARPCRPRAAEPAGDDGSAGDSDGDSSAVAGDGPPPRPPEVTGVSPGAGAPPSALVVGEPRPNVLARGGRAALQFGLPAAARARARLVAPSGRLVATLLDRDLPAGWHALEIDPVGGAGGAAAATRSSALAPLAPGVYLVIVEAGEHRIARRLTVVR
jgi:hypothetical protein